MASNQRDSLRIGRIEQLTHTPPRTPRTRGEMLDEIYADSDDDDSGIIRASKHTTCKCGLVFKNPRLLERHIKDIHDKHGKIS